MLLGTLLPAKRRGFNPYSQHVQVAFSSERYNLPSAFADEGPCDSAKSALESKVCAATEAQKAFVYIGNLHVHALDLCRPFCPNQASSLAKVGYGLAVRHFIFHPSERCQ